MQLTEDLLPPLSCACGSGSLTCMLSHSTCFWDICKHLSKWPIAAPVSHTWCVPSHGLYAPQHSPMHRISLVDRGSLTRCICWFKVSLGHSTMQPPSASAVLCAINVLFQK